MKKKIIVTIFNQKGGVGKTTITGNISYALMMKGYKVLMIDLDPQNNLTSFFLGNKGSKYNLENTIIEEVNINDIIVQVKECLFLISSSKYLIRGKEKLSLNRIGGHTFLKRAIENIKEDYDFIIIDNSSEFDILCLNSFMASNYYICPISLEYFGLLGFEKIQENVRNINENLREKEIIFLGFIPNSFDKRIKSSINNLEELKKKYKDILPCIRVNCKLKEGPVLQKTCFEFKDKKGIEDFTKVRDKIIKKIKEKGEYI